MAIKDNGNGVSDSIADEVIGVPQVGMVQEWIYEAQEVEKKGRRSRQKASDIPSERSMYMPVKRKDGPTMKELSVRIVQTDRLKKVKISRSTMTLWRKDPDTGINERVVDVDVVSPLEPNSENTERWPHFHRGKKRERFDKDKAKALGNPKEQLDFFLKMSNMELDKPIDDIDPNDFKLV